MRVLHHDASCGFVEGVVYDGEIYYHAEIKLNYQQLEITENIGTKSGTRRRASEREQLKNQQNL